MAEKPKQISLRDNAQESLDYLVEILKDNNLYSNPAMFRVHDIQELIDAINFKHSTKNLAHNSNHYIVVLNVETRKAIKCDIRDFSLLYGIGVEDINKASKRKTLILGRYRIYELDEDIEGKFEEM